MRSKMVGSWCAMAVPFLAMTASLQGQPALRAELIAIGLDRPVHITSIPGDEDRLLVAEQYTGAVRVIDLQTREIAPAPFLTVPNVGALIEEGVKSVVIPPTFSDDGRLYVMYTDANRVTHVSRVTMSEASLGTPQFEDLLTLSHPSNIHHGGSMAWSPNDDYLYIGFGDGGGAGDPGDRGQDLTTWHGKILRIDVDVPEGYEIPSDNPFVTDRAIGAGIPRREIWAYGLRNPWRFSFDRDKKHLYIADVGQSTREEINFQSHGSDGGENYGWKCREGTTVFQSSTTNPCGSCDDPACPFVDPIHDYGPEEGRCVVGGYVYRGDDLSALRGRYFFGDYVSGRVWTMRVNNHGEISEFLDRTAELVGAEGTLSGIVSFGEDDRGELYFCGRQSGSVWKIVAAD